MSDHPLIVRVVMAADWHEALSVTSKTAVERATARHGYAFEPTEWKLTKPDRIDWKNARAGALLCASAAAEDGDEELAAAYFALGADPSGVGWRTLAGSRTYVPVMRELGRAIVADPALLDDERFCETAEGWRFLEIAGSDGHDDLIVAAKMYGAMGRIDRDSIRAWAKMWSEVKS